MSSAGTSPPRLRRRRPSRRRLITLVAVGAQLPALLIVTLASGGWGALGLAPAIALTASFLVALEGPYAINPKNELHLYLGLWPFFAWWTACAAMLPLALVVVPLVKLAGFSLAHGTGVAAGLAAAVGLQAVRRRPRVLERTMTFADLPPELDGYRIAQISDVHCGTFAPESRVASWARQVTELDADLVAVTGDLIVRGDSHLDAVARALGQLRGRDGVFVAMGNHDYWGGGERLVHALQREGLHVLRNGARAIRRGGATLLVAAVDDSWSGRAHLPSALARRPADAFPILLAHDPDLFDEAARHGARLTLSGHTHGGQIAVPFFAERWNLAQLVHRYSLGTYRIGDAILYVNGGIGTSGPPIRIGVPSEITLITLRRAVLD